MFNFTDNLFKTVKFVSSGYNSISLVSLVIIFVKINDCFCNGNVPYNAGGGVVLDIILIYIIYYLKIKNKKNLLYIIH